MKKLSFIYCPICGKELDTGRAKFPAPNSIFETIEAKGKYYSDTTSEQYNGHPVKKIFQTYDELFTVQTWGADNLAGYCKDCKKIFVEFEVTDKI